MAKAKECDRCGELYKCQCDIPIISISVYYPTTGGKEIDLCPKCKKAILEWLKQPAEQATNDRCATCGVKMDGESNA